MHLFSRAKINYERTSSTTFGLPFSESDPDLEFINVPLATTAFKKALLLLSGFQFMDFFLVGRW